MPPSRSGQARPNGAEWRKFDCSGTQRFPRPHFENDVDATVLSTQLRESAGALRADGAASSARAHHPVSSDPRPITATAKAGRRSRKVSQNRAPSSGTRPGRNERAGVDEGDFE